MNSNRNQPIYRRSAGMVREGQGQRQKRKPTQAPDHHDAYLRATCASRVPVSVHFLDGEVIESATISQVHMFTLLLAVGASEVLVYKNALKKISSVAKC